MAAVETHAIVLMTASFDMTALPRIFERRVELAGRLGDRWPPAPRKRGG
jgi:hypothetical protein